MLGVQLLAVMTNQRILMSLKIKIREYLSKLFYCTGVSSRRIGFHGRRGYLVIMYHRVLPDDYRNFVQSGMFVNKRAFKMHMQFLKENFKVLPLSEIISEQAKIHQYNKPLCAITFDDGWIDFYKHAYPILNELKIPATVFLPTNYIGTKLIFWEDKLCSILYAFRKENVSIIFKENGEYQLIDGAPYPIDTYIEKAVASAKKYTRQKIEKIICEIDPKSEYFREEICFMSWDQIREMLNSELISYGSHSEKHLILTLCNNQEIENEAISSMEALYREGVADRKFIPFCYPNGSYDERVARIIKAAGYSAAVTTRNGWYGYGNNKFEICRIGLHQDISRTVEMLSYRLGFAKSHGTNHY